jgi:hypothetical protein
VSNSVSFTVSGNGNCGTYPYSSNCCGGVYPYNNCCNNNYGYNYNCNLAPTISSVGGPTSVSTGVSNTWTVTVNNPSSTYMTTSVNWGDSGNGYVNMAAPQVTYTQGTQTLSFTHAYVTAGTYTITFTVSNGSGQSNTSTMTVTVGGGYYGGSVTLSSINPSSGQRGSVVTLYGTNFTASDNVVHFGVGGLRYVPSGNGGTTISYTIPYWVSPCDLVGSGCTAATQQVNPGSYQVYVTNGYGTSQTVNFTVTN